LDDYHTLDESSTVHEFIRLFIDFMPEQCHMIIASRTVPPFPLIRLVARQQMAAIGVDELRFTTQEIQELASRNFGATLTDEQIKALSQQTDGWITAILLSADTGWDRLLQSQDAAFLDLSETGIYDFLMSEVLSNQSDPVRRFLLHTSVLDELTVQICDHLVDQDSQPILRILEKHNLFISRVEQEGLETAFRYHPLFQEFLVNQLCSQDPDLYRDLNLSAAEYYAQAENWHAALTHYSQAQCFVKIKDIVLAHYQELDTTGHRESLAHWIDSLPPGQCPAGLQLKRAALANDLEQIDTALRLYTNVIVYFEGAGNKRELALALIERSYALSRSGNYGEAITDCQEALSLLSDEQGTESLQGRAYRYLGAYYAETGDPPSALHFLARAQQSWTKCNAPPSRMALLAQTTGMAYEMEGKFQQALQQCQKALAIWQSLQNAVGIADALNGVGVAYHRLGKYSEALETLSSALDESRTAGSIRAAAYALASLGDLYRDLGQFEQALAFYDQSLDQNDLLGEAFLNSYLLNMRAETLYLAGQTERARAEIEHTLSQEILPHPHQTRHRIVLAATLIRQNNSNQARQLLERVLQEPNLQAETAFRGHLKLAQAAMVENQPEESKQHLQRAICLAQEAGLTQPLCVESLNHLGVLQFVTEQSGQDNELEKWIKAAQDLEKVRKKLAASSQDGTVTDVFPELRIETLGTSQVFKADELVSWRTTQSKELFLYMLTHPNGQTKEQIGATIWPNHSRAKLFSIFRSSLFRLRKALFSEVVLYEDEQYLLNPDIEYTYDVRAFQESFTQAETADNPVQRAHHYRRAVDQYKGEFLADLYADWILDLREALRTRYLQALSFLAQFNLGNRNYPQAIGYARQILSTDEHHEIAYQILITAYVRCGQRPRAKQIYDEYRQMLAEFDLEPQRDWGQLSQS
jgi:ATP/maltotriose-dependent transcriptional regulator MalT/DNA-binding SARP family transcriptional activator